MHTGNSFIVIILLAFGEVVSLQAQKLVAPNDIPVPWYSQKFAGCPYAHCSLASSLMVFDYYKGMTPSNQRSVQEARTKND